MIKAGHAVDGARDFWNLLKRAWVKWSEDNAQRLGAALAYYTVFSMAPLLIIVIAIVGLVFGPSAARGLVVEQLSGFMGVESAQALQQAIQSSYRPASGLIASVVGAVTLLLGATGVVNELQASLNLIWKARPTRTGLLKVLINRIIALGFILALGFLLLVSLLLSAILSALGKYFGAMLPISEAVLHALNFSLSFYVIMFLFAMIYKMLPDATVAWRDVWMGAGVTSALFTLGNFLLGLYLGKSSLASAYGAAGSVILILFWTYYCAQILYFGAEFTQIYASTRGSRAEAGHAHDGQKKFTHPR